MKNIMVTFEDIKAFIYLAMSKGLQTTVFLDSITVVNEKHDLCCSLIKNKLSVTTLGGRFSIKLTDLEVAEFHLLVKEVEEYRRHIAEKDFRDFYGETLKILNNNGTTTE